MAAAVTVLPPTFGRPCSVQPLFMMHLYLTAVHFEGPTLLDNAWLKVPLAGGGSFQIKALPGGPVAQLQNVGTAGDTSRSLLPRDMRSRLHPAVLLFAMQPYTLRCAGKTMLGIIWWPFLSQSR